MSVDWSRDIAQLSTARTLLFVPGDRPERFDKAVSTGADAVVLDLEDAVAADAKTHARNAIREWVRQGGRALIRVNAIGTDHHEEDVACARELGVPVMLAKAESPDHVRSIAQHVPVVALVETSAGVIAAPQLAGIPGVVRLALGHMDLAAELGIDPADRTALLYSRSALVMASAAGRLPGPIDGVTTAVRDADLLRDNVNHARALGMTGTLCIHPSQVDVAHQQLRPAQADVEWAQSILEASNSDGVSTLNGHMIDPPVIARARNILAQN